MRELAEKLRSKLGAVEVHVYSDFDSCLVGNGEVEINPPQSPVVDGSLEDRGAPGSKPLGEDAQPDDFGVGSLPLFSPSGTADIRTEPVADIIDLRREFTLATMSRNRDAPHALVEAGDEHAGIRVDDRLEYLRDRHPSSTRIWVAEDFEVVRSEGDEAGA